MSKNECKRCSECKHYERVNDNELEDHGDCTLYPIWVDVWAAHYCGQWASVQKEDTLTTGLDIDWNQVPEGYDWVAQDECGVVWAYEIEPDLGESQWRLRETHNRLTTFNNHITVEPNPNWRNTLTKRPGTN